MYSRSLTRKTILGTPGKIDNFDSESPPWSHIGSFVHDQATGGVISGMLYDLTLPHVPSDLVGEAIHSHGRVLWLSEFV